MLPVSMCPRREHLPAGASCPGAAGVHAGETGRTNTSPDAAARTTASVTRWVTHSVSGSISGTHAVDVSAQRATGVEGTAVNEAGADGRRSPQARGAPIAAALLSAPGFGRTSDGTLAD
ncbi:hypothetical protein DQ04_06611020 [Trypanosoma grayi]|uniref:hypothetical protein n=1 Tax=Trypanosoma grayi TaxID=71804 RepID=UPI0004F4295F|nr:hypothetical protein DQ04_06611020 [Trypanosoma grayi]KEG08703.1 hypothetical protein DQ04_06611020 [Trypanosoma grayi]